MAWVRGLLLWDRMPTLAEIDTAIETVIERGQTVEVNGRRITRANLSELWAMRKQVAGLEDREERGGMRVRQVVPRG